MSSFRAPPFWLILKGNQTGNPHFGVFNFHISASGGNKQKEANNLGPGLHTPLPLNIESKKGSPLKGVFCRKGGFVSSSGSEQMPCRRLEREAGSAEVQAELTAHWEASCGYWHRGQRGQRGQRRSSDSRRVDFSFSARA